MAKPVDLVELLSKTLDIPKARIVLHDRNLADTGLRTVKGRGRNSATITPSDAANLLVAAVASRNVKDSAATVAKFADEARAIALDTERAMTGTKPSATYSLRSTSGEAFWVAGFSGNAVLAVAELLSNG